MSIKTVAEVYKKMKEEQIDEAKKQLSTAQKKEMDVDNDGDIDGKDLKKLRSKKDKKSDEVELRVESVVDYHREVNSQIAQRYREMLEASHADQTKGATAPEAMDAKDSGIAKTMRADHKGGVIADGEVQAKTATDAGRATSKAPGRHNDQ